MIEVIKTIAMLCALHTGADKTWLDSVNTLQNQCHRYYAVCLGPENLKWTSETLLDCMKKREVPK